MRSAGNFHPEWGYLAPAPSFMRTARVALVATAIGATAGAIVVVSLVTRSGATDDDSSIAAHALVTAVPVVSAAPVVNSPVISAAAPGKAPAALAQVPMPPQALAVHTRAQPQPPTAKPVPDNLANATTPPPALASPLAPPANVTALADTPPAVDVSPVPAAPDSAATPEASPTKKTDLRKRRPTAAEAARRWQTESNARKRWREDRGFGPLFRLFSFRDSSSYEN